MPELGQTKQDVREGQRLNGAVSSMRPGRSRLTLLLLGLIASAYSLWTLSLPLFPTRDGPAHLYYTSILADLLFHHGQTFGHFFTVKHALPPYSLYYYLLMLLGRWVAMVAADKIILCLYFFVFVFGFRYVATAIGPQGDAMSLLATLLLINWPLGMGFVNFCLATGLALWMLGLWYRFAGRRDLKRRMVFLVLAFATMLTHPVPLLLALGCCWVEFGIRVAKSGGGRSDRRRVLVSSDLVTLALAMTTTLYIKAFTFANVMVQQAPSRYTWRELLHGSIINYVLLHSLVAFTGHGLADAVYRGSFYLLLGVAFVLIVRRRRRTPAHTAWQAADTWAAMAVLLAVAMPFIPRDLNHSNYFAYRLVIYVWIAALLAASGGAARFSEAPLSEPGHSPVDTGWRGGWIAAAIFSLVATAATLALGEQKIRPLAVRLAEIERPAPVGGHPAALPGETGLLLTTVDYDKAYPVTYDPYYWASMHLFRETRSIAANSPWLDLAIIPIGEGPAIASLGIPPKAYLGQYEMRNALALSLSRRRQILSHTDFVVFLRGEGPEEDGLDPILADPAQAGGHWVCGPWSWYRVCRREKDAAAPMLPSTTNTESVIDSPPGLFRPIGQ